MYLAKIIFIEIMNNWIRKQNVFGERKFFIISIEYLKKKRLFLCF